MSLLNTSQNNSEDFIDDKAVRRLMKSKLAQGPCRVTFTKKDGTERTMICTTLATLAEKYEKKTDRVKVVDQDVCPVYDLEKKAWRSFKFTSVIEFQGDIKWG